MLEEIKKSLKPGRETEKKIKEIKEDVKSRIESQGYETIAVGSTSRGTYLPGDIDIDIFFYFPEEISREELEEKGVEVGEKALQGYDPKKHYAEHPYVKGEKNGIEVEVVPCYRTEGKPRSAVDRSPLHDDYLEGKLTEEDKKEVRMLKKFLKNMNCYGAKERVRGFSGYLCELLILKYGSFESVLEAASEWSEGECIDIEEHGEKGFNDPLVVIDPVDPDRNVASALSNEKLGRFILRARELLEDPSEENFEADVEIDHEVLEGKKMLLVTFPAPSDTVSEITWSQLRKLDNDLCKTLEEKEFQVYRSVHWTDEEKTAEVLLDLKDLELPGYEKHRGPPFHKKKHSKRFRERNEDIFIQGNRLYAWRKRKYIKAEELIESFFENEERVPSRFQEISGEPEIIKDINEIKKHEEILRKYFKV